MFSFMTLASGLPPVIARSEVRALFGGVISPKTLANLDAQGLGPSGKHTLAGRVFYETPSLLSWLDERQRKTTDGGAQ